MAKSKNTAVEGSESTTSKTVEHNPCTIAGGKCRLAAIASIAEPMPFVAKAYAGQAREYAEAAVNASDDSVKDKKTVATANRWVLAAETAADADGDGYRS